MIQVINPKTGHASDCEVLVCRDHYAEVVLNTIGRTIRVDYDNIRWVSPDWYKR